MPAGAKKWAELLIDRVDFERISLITESKKIYETTIIDGVERKKRIEDIPGKVEFKKGEINNADFSVCVMSWQERSIRK